MQKKKHLKWAFGILALVILITTCIVGISGLIYVPDNTHQDTIVHDESENTRDLFPDKAYPEIAIGYSVEYHDTYKVVIFHDPWGRPDENHTYILVQRGEKNPEGYPDAQVFFIPVQKVVTTLPANVAEIDAINGTSSIIGHSGIKTINNAKIHELEKNEKIVDIGRSTAKDMERIIRLDPDVVFCDTNGNKESDNYYKFQEVGLQPVITAEWLESDPLGRAEWIKYYSLFYNQEKKANIVFDQIKNNYFAIQELTNNITIRPTIFTGFTYQGTWYADGGNGYVSKLFQDAGGNYIWGNDTKREYQKLDFEFVYDQAHTTDFLINVMEASNTTYETLLTLDPRYAKFGVFNTGKIYNTNERINAFGGNEFWESGVIKPDVVLADLVKILHPELLPDHKLYYFKHISPNQTEGMS